MANTSSAKRTNKADQRKHVFNVRRTRAMKSSVKDISSAISDGNKSEAEKMFSTVQKALDKAVKRGVIKKNTASRKKSRLAAAIKSI